jgi:homoserine kinase type II
MAAALCYKRRTMYSAALLKEVLKFWAIDLKRICPEIEIAGSPERCDFRVVVEDKKKRLYIVENISPQVVDHKIRIIQTLEFLKTKGLEEVQTYIPPSEDSYVIHHQDSYWQLVPYVEGIELQRPEYVFDRWRGRVLADFLIQLNKTSGDVPYFDRNDPFSIKKYVYDMLEKLKRHEPGLAKKVRPIFHFLKTSFMEIHDRLPVIFTHGDYHPLNIIWSENSMKAVIDWEFTGYKPESYDAANLIGCIGIENPQALIGDLVTDFIKTLQKAEIFSDQSWEFLLEFILAIRFGWLAEWLRKSDKEMIDLEVVYMNLLVDNAETLRKSWNI